MTATNSNDLHKMLIQRASSLSENDVKTRGELYGVPEPEAKPKKPNKFIGLPDEKDPDEKDPDEKDNHHDTVGINPLAGLKNLIRPALRHALHKGLKAKKAP